MPVDPMNRTNSDRSPGRYGPTLRGDDLAAELEAAKLEAFEARASASILEGRVAELTAEVDELKSELAKLREPSARPKTARKGPPPLPAVIPGRRLSESIDVSNIAEMIVERRMSRELTVADIASLIRDTLDRADP